MKKYVLAGAAFAAALVAAGNASASPYIVNTDFGSIGARFDDVIAGTGSTVTTAQVVWDQSTYDYIDKDGNAATVTVTRPDGSPFTPDQDYWGLSGYAWSIDPYSSAADLIPGYNSGLTFTFSSLVNAFGFEVGDWATCCTYSVRPANIASAYGVPVEGSGLWIAFDGGAATLPANALSDFDNPGYAAGDGYLNFIGAIDSSGYFSSITFFGDGWGEYLVAGGTLRFASVPQGSVTGDVSESASLALLGLGMVGFGAIRRRKAA